MNCLPGVFWGSTIGNFPQRPLPITFALAVVDNFSELAIPETRMASLEFWDNAAARFAD
jgi:hypothetical protein